MYSIEMLTIYKLSEIIPIAKHVSGYEANTVLHLSTAILFLIFNYCLHVSKYRMLPNNKLS